MNICAGLLRLGSGVFKGLKRIPVFVKLLFNLLKVNQNLPKPIKINHLIWYANQVTGFKMGFNWLIQEKVSNKSFK